jgi:protein-L-isoaspartate(D-aspartate) O-methyltransferase
MTSQSNDLNYDALREEMVQHLIREGGIRDENIIRALRAVPRHLFVAEPLRPQAYKDHAMPIEYEQTISQPYIVAKMTELLALTENDKVLEIGTGSGYQTAILAKIVHQVYSIERLPELAQAAQALLRSLGIDNVWIRVGDGSEGWAEEAPFAGIIVTACAPQIPEVLVRQLATGGRLVIPVGSEHSQRLIRVRRYQSGQTLEDHGSCVFVRLIGKHGWMN